MHCGIYIRKSRESEEAYRLEFQREKLPDYAESQGWTYTIYDEGFKSGKSFEDMQELNRLIGDIKDGKINIVLVIEFSRLSRDESLQNFTYFLDLCKNQDVKIATPGKIRDPKDGQEWLLCILEGGFSSLEMRQIKKRMEEGRRQAQDEGRYLGGNPPFGYRVLNKKLVPIPREAEIVKKIFTGVALEHSPNEIEKLIIQNRLSLGHALSARQIRRVLEKSLKYAGLTRDSKGDIIEGDWEAIITKQEREAYLKTVQIRTKRPKSTQSTHLCTGLGIFRCGHCGHSIGSAGKIYKDVKRIYYYCSSHRQSHTNCKESIAVDLEFLDRTFVEAFKKLFVHNVDVLLELIEGKNNLMENQIKSHKQEKQSIEAKISRLVKAVADGIFDQEVIKSDYINLKNRLDVLERLIPEVESQSRARAEEDIRSLAEEVRNFESLEFGRQRYLVKALIRRVNLFNDKIEIFPKHTEIIEPDFSLTILIGKNGRPVWLNALKVDLTREKYDELKKCLKTDKDIAIICGVSERTIRRWKKREMPEEYTGWESKGWYLSTDIRQ